MDLRDTLHAVRRGWWLLSGSVLLGLAIASATCWAATPLYSSSTQLFVTAADRPDAESANEWAIYVQQRTATYAAALASTDMAGRVIDELGLDLRPADLVRRVTARAVPNTAVLEVTVTDSSPRRARDIAASLGRQFTGWVDDAETTVGAVTSRVSATTVQPARLSTRAVSPDVGLALGLGGSLGFLLGLGLTVSGRRSWNTVTTEDDVRNLTGAALIGVMPEIAPSEPRRPDAPQEWSTADALDGILANLGLLGIAGPQRVLVVAGAEPEDAAGELARELADALALAGRRVALVEADLRSDESAPSLAPEGTVGFADVLAGEATLAAVTAHAHDGQLSVIPAGRPPARTEGLLESRRMGDVVYALRSTHDYVLLIAPPVRSSPDATILGRRADGCLLAVRYGRIGRIRLADTAGRLTGNGVRLLGVVLTQVPHTVTVVQSPSHRYWADPDRATAVALRRAVRSSTGPAAPLGGES